MVFLQEQRRIKGKDSGMWDREVGRAFLLADLSLFPQRTNVVTMEVMIENADHVQSCRGFQFKRTTAVMQL